MLNRTEPNSQVMLTLLLKYTLRTAMVTCDWGAEGRGEGGGGRGGG